MAVTTAPTATTTSPAATTVGGCQLAVTGAGQGLAKALVSDLIISSASSAPVEQSGSATAAQEVGGELGGAVGIALAGAVGLVAYRASLSDVEPTLAPEWAVREAKASVHEGVGVAADLPTAGG